MKRYPKLFFAGLFLLFMLFSSAGCGAGRKESFRPAISGNGRYVVFASYDRELHKLVNAECSDDDQLCWQIYVRDMETGELAIVSTDSRGEPAMGPGSVGNDAYGFPYAGGTSSPFGKGPTSLSISDDGRFVVFSSSALDAGGGAAILFRKDLQSGELQPVSPTPSEPMKRATFFLPAMSGDGRFIAYWTYSPASILAGGNAHLFVRDMSQAEPEPISFEQLPAGTKPFPPEAPNPVSISADGRFIAFGTSLPSLGTGYQTGVFILDRQTGELRIISSTSGGADANGPSRGASISGDGRFAVFESGASNLVSEPTCKQITASCTNVYLKDLQSGQTTLLSKTESGAAMNNAGSPVISEDGGAAAFVVLKSTTPTSETEPTISSPAVRETIYHSDLKSGRTVPVTPEVSGLTDSESIAGTVPTYGSARQVLPVSGGVAGAQGVGISTDGRFIAFPSLSSWLGMEDRMCGARYANDEPLFGLSQEPDVPCVEIFFKDIQSGNLSRVSVPD